MEWQVCNVFKDEQTDRKEMEEDLRAREQLNVQSPTGDKKKKKKRK